MAIIIDQYGPIFMIKHNMCDGCMDRRMDVHTDRRMSGRKDEIITQSHSSDTEKKELYFSYMLHGLLNICKNTPRVRR